MDSNLPEFQMAPQDKSVAQDKAKSDLDSACKISYFSPPYIYIKFIKGNKKFYDIICFILNLFSMHFRGSYA